MSTRPTVGVLITYHDEQTMLQECLDSLARQSSPPDEVLVYDDCSQYAAADYLIREIKVEVMRGTRNQGPSAARNQLLVRSQSDYIHFHDADDVFCPSWNERVREAIGRTGADVILTNIATFSKGGVSQDPFYDFRDLRERDDLLRHAIRSTLVPSVGTYRRTCVERIGGYRSEMRFSEDHDFHIRLFLSCASHALIDESLVMQRIHERSASNNKLLCWVAGVDVLRRALEVVPLGNRRDVADAAADLGSRLVRIGATGEARDAFRLANAAGGASFANQKFFYRWIARHLGPVCAERVSAIYRAWIPERIRRMA